MAEYNYTCGDCLHVQICEGDPSLRNVDRKNTAYCKGFKNAADVVEVVRCKGCIYYENNYCGFWEEYPKTEKNDFCSSGKRRAK